MAVFTPPAGIRLSGRLGNVVYRNIGGRTFISRAPAPSNKPPTERQLAVRNRFRLAAVYAQAALSNPVARAFYERVAAAKDRTAFSAAQGDYLSAPVIRDIALTLYQGHPADEIVVVATDDTQVVSVKVTIRDMVGKVVEAGEAGLRHDIWLYVATKMAPAGQPLTVEVTAMDRAGNEVTRSTAWIPGADADAWTPYNGREAKRPSRENPTLIT
jgi:hypothetical protein